MSSFPKNEKTKKQVEIESKKSPKRISKEESDQKKQNKPIEKERQREKTIRLSKEKLNEKIITNEPIEKEMLKGQEHKEEENKEEKNINDLNSSINNNINNNIEISNFNLISPRNDKNDRIDRIDRIDKNDRNDKNDKDKEKDKDKDTIEVKPRETYLKEKIMKMNYNEKLFLSINKSLDNQVKSIHNDILDNQVLITTISKNNNKKPYLPESLSAGDITNLRNYDSKFKLKTIKELKNEEENIKNNLKQLLENEKLIKDESFTKLYSLKQSQSNLSLDKILKIEKLKKIENKKNAYIQQINEIDFKINEIMNNNKNELLRKNKLKSFIDNFERDKEIAEIRAKKYYKESKQISLRMEKDIKKIVDKVKKELEEKEKEDKKKKLNILKDFKKKEKYIEQKRYQEYMKKVLSFKNFILEKPKLKLKDYLFNKNAEKFLQEEAKVIRLENNKRKAYMKSITKEELNEFSNNFNENKEKYNSIKQAKRHKLFNEWKERKNLLPTYVSSFSEAANIENKKLEEEELLKEERIHTLIQLKKDFSNQIKEEKQPPINKKLKQKRLDEINKLENPKLFIVKDTLSKRKKKRVILKKRDPNKPSRFKWKLKLDDDPFDKLNKSDSINDTLIKKPKKIKVSFSFENKEHKPVEKKIDYLREMAIKREEKERKKSINLTQPKSNGQKWDKIINQFDGNIIENVNNVKQKADFLEKKAIMNEKILNLNGGIENNPELGQKVSSLLIDSIEAKLSILNKITK